MGGKEHGELVALLGRQGRRMINEPADVIFPAEARRRRLADTVRRLGAAYGAVGIGHDGHPSARHTYWALITVRAAWWAGRRAMRLCAGG